MERVCFAAVCVFTRLFRFPARAEQDSRRGAPRAPVEPKPASPGDSPLRQLVEVALAAFPREWKCPFPTCRCVAAALACVSVLSGARALVRTASTGH